MNFQKYYDHFLKFDSWRKVESIHFQKPRKVSLQVDQFSTVHSFKEAQLWLVWIWILFHISIC